MKKSVGKIFVRSFLKSLVVIMVFIGIGMFSYQMVMHFWEVPDANAMDSSKELEKIKIIEVSIDDISKNLIYCIDEDTGEIEKILLEIFHLKNKKMYYITIPVRTQFTMTDTLYRRLVPVNPTIPQMIKLSGVTKYFDKDTVYDYGALLIEDMLKIKISYYTVIPQKVYETMFVTEELNSEGMNMPKEVFSEEYLRFLKTLDTAEAISNYIEKLYSSIQSNLSLYEKMNYLESYDKTPLSNVYFDMIRGENQNSAYKLHTDLATQQIADYILQSTEE